MIAGIEQAFHDGLGQLTWMDDATRAAALAEAERALSTLEYIPDGIYKNALHDLASQLLVRRS